MKNCEGLLERKLLNPATKLLKLAMKLLKPGDELLRPAKVKVQCGKQPRDYEHSWERQVEAGASCVPQDLGKFRGHVRRRAQATRRAREKDESGRQSKRAQLPESSPTGRDR